VKLTREELVEKFRPVLHLLVSDREYVIPTEEWLYETFLPWWDDVAVSLRLQYGAAADCDDFALGCWFFARRCAAGLHDATSDTSVPIGFCIYKTRAGTTHAINVAVVGEDKRTVFIEPQTAKSTVLTREERESISWVLF